MKHNCSILILSCDKNIKLLELFFIFFNKYWQDCPYEIYISLEKCKNINANRKVNIINYNRNMNWSERVKDALNNIPTENVIIMLDDFLIEAKVNNSEIIKLDNVLSENGIANILLTEIIGENTSQKSILSKYALRAKYGRYKTALQCGIWNKEILIRLLKDRETPWEFEIFGNIRSFKINERFFALEDNSKKPILYNDGFFIVQGKVNKSEKNRLENKHGISLNLEGFEESGPYLVRDNTPFLKRITRRVKIIIYYCFYRIRSYSGSK